MVEYIDRKTLIKAVEDLPNYYNGFSDTYDKACIIGLIEELPSADAVEIKKEGEWDMFDLISSAWYGKGMYFKQDNGMVYSRHSGEYMTVDEAIREFISLIEV